MPVRGLMSPSGWIGMTTTARLSGIVVSFSRHSEERLIQFIHCAIARSVDGIDSCSGLLTALFDNPLGNRMAVKLIEQSLGEMAIPDQSIPEGVTHIDGRQAVAKLLEKNRIALAILVLSQRRQTTQIVEQHRFDFRFGSLDKSVQIFEEERTDALELTVKFFFNIAISNGRGYQSLQGRHPHRVDKKDPACAGRTHEIAFETKIGCKINSFSLLG